MRVLGVGLITDQLKSGMKTLITPNLEKLSFFQRLGCIFKCVRCKSTKQTFISFQQVDMKMKSFFCVDKIEYKEHVAKIS